METRISHLKGFRLLLALMMFLNTVMSCTSVEAKRAALGSNDFCMNSLLTLSLVSSKLDMLNTRGAVTDSGSNDNSLSKTMDKAVPPNHEVRASSGKGLGVFATHFIPQGSSILIEAPLVTVAMPEIVQGQGFRITDMIEDLENAFHGLSPAAKNDFLDLHDFRFPTEQDQNHLLTIFRSNAYNTGDDKIGLFPRIARINHSCRPNAGTWWSEKTQRRMIYAMRGIEEGEEITVSYIPLLKPTNDRQTRLAQYGFVCDCHACSEGSNEGDKKRVRISEWLGDLERKVGRKSEKREVNEKRVEKAKKLVEMVESEGLGDYFARAYHLVAVLNEHAEEYEEAETWARRELKALEWAERDSVEALTSVLFIDSLGAWRQRHT